MQDKHHTIGIPSREGSFLNGAREIPDCAQVFKHHGVAASDPTSTSSGDKEFSATLFEEPSLQASLRRIIAKVNRNTIWEEDLMQEGLVHLWEVERSKPGQTKSWYLQSCRFHIRHWLERGRSLDSPKRAQPDKRIVLEENESETALPEYHTNGEVFEAVSFRDLVSTLAKHLKPRERIVLCGLAEGHSVGEIGTRFGISRPTVLKDRRRIAALTNKLGHVAPIRG